MGRMVFRYSSDFTFHISHFTFLYSVLRIFLKLPGGSDDDDHASAAIARE